MSGGVVEESVEEERVQKQGHVEGESAEGQV
jgi:hypothetical protein